MTDLHPLLYADFNNADALGRLRLNCNGTARDLAGQGIVLRDGLQVRLHDEELEADGFVRYSAEENAWVAVIDWEAVRPAGRDSDRNGLQARRATLG